MDTGSARSLEKAWKTAQLIPPLKETQKSGADFLACPTRSLAQPRHGSCHSDQVGVMCQLKSRLAWRGVLQ